MGIYSCLAPNHTRTAAKPATVVKVALGSILAGKPQRHGALTVILDQFFSLNILEKAENAEMAQTPKAEVPFEKCPLICFKLAFSLGARILHWTELGLKIGNQIRLACANEKGAKDPVDSAT